MAHQFADVLLLAPQSTVGFHRSCLQNGFAKIVVQRQALELALFQRDQFLAQLLQCQVLAFFRAFAGL